MFQNLFKTFRILIYVFRINIYVVETREGIQFLALLLLVQDLQHYCTKDGKEKNFSKNYA